MNVLVGKNVFENEIAKCSHLSCTFLQFSLVSEDLLRMRDLIFQTETVWLVISNLPLIGTNFSLYFVACLMERCESTFCFFFFKYFFFHCCPILSTWPAQLLACLALNFHVSFLAFSPQLQTSKFLIPSSFLAATNERTRVNINYIG